MVKEIAAFPVKEIAAFPVLFNLLQIHAADAQFGSLFLLSNMNHAYERPLTWARSHVLALAQLPF